MHLCRRALTTQKQWTDMFLSLVDHIALVQSQLARIGDPIEAVGFDPREPLIWVWCVLDTMPNAQDQRYQALRETAADDTGIAARADALRHRGYAMPGLKTALDLQITWLAALARALDEDLSDLNYWPDDITEWTQAAWQPPGYNCYVVPVRRGHRLGDGRPAQRRAFRYHAVIPQYIGTMQVQLSLHPDASRNEASEDPARWVLGAATFPGLSVVPKETSTHFRLTAAPVEGDEEELLAGQIDDAKGAGCDVLAWPELTMPPERLALLLAKLGQAPLDGQRIPLVIAGSWHVAATVNEGKVADHYANRAEVMLGDGQPIFSYDKRRLFPWNNLYEDIRPGNSLPVVVMEDRLVGVAICRDNCDDIDKESYKDLPMDMVIVPSMGGQSTVEAQERHAMAQRSRQGTVTLVVQQNPPIAGEPGPEGPFAYSFVRPVEGERYEIAQTTAFRVLR